ncbi:MAG TPA: hypothetical protein VER08_10610 [Pyrinomonadaceae bacterium]|nr:hypothetical protein [Pyrinomonadaceae bacterium]
MTASNEGTGGFLHVSSLADDVWHGDGGPGAYEWWYFDAFSNDGRDALVVIFLADFIFSPRFNRHAARHDAASAARFPAVAVSLYRDGRPLWRAVNEYAAQEFSASTQRPECRIGRSGFRLEGGRVFRVSLDETLRRGRRLRASLAWELDDGRPGDVGGSVGGAAGSLKGGAGGGGQVERGGAHEWNLVAPRCRVEGSLYVDGRGGARVGERRFEGTGYHDHNRDRRWLPATVAEWSWGRAHFPGATAVFYSYRERAASAPVTRLFLARGGTLTSHVARLAAEGSRRHVFGLRHARALRVEAEDANASLVVRQRRVVDGSYFYLRFVGDAVLDTGDGPAQTAPAISERLAPRALRWRWLDWLTDMRVGRRGRGSFLK